MVGAVAYVGGSSSLGVPEPSTTLLTVIGMGAMTSRFAAGADRVSGSVVVYDCANETRLHVFLSGCAKSRPVCAITSAELFARRLCCVWKRIDY